MRFRLARGASDSLGSSVGHSPWPPDEGAELLLARDGLAIFDGVRPGRGYGTFRGTRRRRRRVLPFFFGLIVVLALGAGIYFGLATLLAEDPPATIEVSGDGGSITGAVVAVDGTEDRAVTGEDGSAELRITPPAIVTVDAPGFKQGRFEVNGLPEEGPLALEVQPLILRGRVEDASQSPVAGAIVRTGTRTATTDEFGQFELRRAEPGTVTVSRPAWSEATRQWEGSATQLEVTLEPLVIRGLRVDLATATDAGALERLMALAERTDVNALVFDLKDERGVVHHTSSVPEASAVGAIQQPTYDLRAVLSASGDLYTIGRIVTFQDSVRSSARPDLAVRDESSGGVWVNAGGWGWMDPTDRAAWEYPLSLGVEACEAGFDEIQFDYVHFPTGGDTSRAAFDVEIDQDVRVETIAEFLTEARDRLHPLGCAVSANLFAIVLSTSDDQGVGQMPEPLSRAVDALSPMVYPSHYGPGWLGFDRPNDHPSEVVGHALDAGVSRLEGAAVLRPWLQGFGYSPAQVRAGIDAAEARGLGWLLWNPDAEYDPLALPSP